jgi:hypothetical protein
MRKRTIIVICLLITAAASVAVALIRRDKQARQPSILTSQLTPEAGVIPVEILRPTASFPKPDEVQDFSCVIQNNTTKGIRSVVLAYTIVTDNNGKESKNLLSLWRESLIHPDVREAHHFRPLVSGENYTFASSGETSFGSPNVITRIELNLDYVEFEDGSRLGPDINGSRIIGSIRKGAENYKAWLVEKYLEQGRSADAVGGLLRAKELPSELQSPDMYINQGAKSYRSHMLDVYTTHGAAELEKFLNRVD